MGYWRWLVYYRCEIDKRLKGSAFENTAKSPEKGERHPDDPNNPKATGHFFLFTIKKKCNNKPVYIARTPIGWPGIPRKGSKFLPPGTEADSDYCAVPDQKQHDDPGHALANRFGGYADLMMPTNVFPQQGSVNQTTFKGYESTIANKFVGKPGKRKEKRICIRIQFAYGANSKKRPSSYTYSYWEDYSNPGRRGRPESDKLWDNLEA